MQYEQTSIDVRKMSERDLINSLKRLESAYLEFERLREKGVSDIEVRSLIPLFDYPHQAQLPQLESRLKAIEFYKQRGFVKGFATVPMLLTSLMYYMGAEIEDLLSSSDETDPHFAELISDLSRDRFGYRLDLSP